MACIPSGLVKRALGRPAFCAGRLLRYPGRTLARHLQRHPRYQIRQDRHTPSLDLESSPQVVLTILLFLAHGATVDQAAHAFLGQRLPILGLGVPQLDGGPVAAASLVAVLAR